MVTAMFEQLTDDERRELASRLRRAGERFGDEANLLAGTPPAVLAAYCLPREGYHDFYSAAIESSMLSVEVWQRPLQGLIDAFDAERARIEGTRAARVPGPAIVPTGTGWPVTR